MLYIKKYFLIKYAYFMKISLICSYLVQAFLCCESFNKHCFNKHCFRPLLPSKTNLKVSLNFFSSLLEVYLTSEMSFASGKCQEHVSWLRYG